MAVFPCSLLILLTRDSHLNCSFVVNTAQSILPFPSTVRAHWWTLYCIGRHWCVFVMVCRACRSCGMQQRTRGSCNATHHHSIHPTSHRLRCKCGIGHFPLVSWFEKEFQRTCPFVKTQARAAQILYAGRFLFIFLPLEYMRLGLGSLYGM